MINFFSVILRVQGWTSIRPADFCFPKNDLFQNTFAALGIESVKLSWKFSNDDIVNDDCYSLHV